MLLTFLIFANSFRVVRLVFLFSFVFLFLVFLVQEMVWFSKLQVGYTRSLSNPSSSFSNYLCSVGLSLDSGSSCLDLGGISLGAGSFVGCFFSRRYSFSNCRLGGCLCNVSLGFGSDSNRFG